MTVTAAVLIVQILGRVAWLVLRGNRRYPTIGDRTGMDDLLGLLAEEYDPVRHHAGRARPAKT
ncbi:hypothetical protein [Streptomyces sp. NPDC060027]|uniref:hypothetical protein n=1 Tax=Streptomyces sp. NPDC060027 TaxID=3347040 RepID=UPI003698564F